MSKYFYPAVFSQEDIGYSVYFPDLEGCFTEGDTLEEAYAMAIDAIGLYVQDEKNNFSFPASSNPKDITVGQNEFIVLIEFDELEYLKRHATKSVKKTLTIPSWLNTLAEEKNINFSNTLQNALMEQLNIDR